jgi:phage gp45-like
MTIVFSQSGLGSAQERLFNAIKELGGKASTAQIRAAVVEDLPSMKFSGQVTSTLWNLEEYGFVSCEKIGAENVWSVVR